MEAVMECNIVMLFKRKPHKDTQRKYVQESPKWNQQECKNDNDVHVSVRLVTMCVCGKAWCERQPKTKTNNDMAGRTTTEKKPAKKPWIQVAQREPVEHDRKEKPTRRLQRKMQCVVRRPAGSVENAHEMVPQVAM